MRKEIQDMIDYITYNAPEHTAITAEYVNWVLYYADWLKICNEHKPLTWAKYFNVNGAPFNSVLLAEYNLKITRAKSSQIVKNFYLDEAMSEMDTINTQFGLSGLKSFITGICNISGQPTVDYWYMLRVAMFSKDKIDKNKANKELLAAEEALTYTSTNEDKTIDSTKYAAD